MEIVADDGVGQPTIDRLRSDGHDVWYVREQHRGIADASVVQCATTQQRLLLTRDKVFGELVMRRIVIAPCGVVLYRLPRFPGGRTQEDIISEVFATYSLQLVSKFTVIEQNSICIRDLPS